MIIFWVLAAGWVVGSVVGLLLWKVAVNRDGPGWAHLRLLGAALEGVGGPMLVAALLWAGFIAPDLLTHADARGALLERGLALARRYLGAFGVRLLFAGAGLVLLWDHWREWRHDWKRAVREWGCVRSGDHAGESSRRKRTMDRYGV